MTRSFFSTGLKDLRDEGQEESPAVRDPKTGAIVEAAKKFRPAWPQGVFFSVKHPADDEDYQEITRRTWESVSNADASVLQKDFKAEQSARATVGVLIRAVAGDGAWVLPGDTSNVIIPSDADARMAVVARLPYSVVQVMSKLIDEANEDPLELRQASKTTLRAVK